MKQRYRSYIPILISGIIFFITSGITHSAYAAPDSQTACSREFVWREINSDQFVVLYTASHISLAEEISETYLQPIKGELDKYSIAFSSSIYTPITIRIYPSETEYYCLNALAPLINSEDSHSHIGTREIALIANVINRSPMTWDAQAINAIRHEIAVLFGEQISSGKAPPGLLQGLGGYFENPEDTYHDRYQEAERIDQPDRGWQRLWEEDIPASDALVLLQQTSTVAYLIDVFGWGKFVNFLEKIAEYHGYRQSLLEVYGVNLQDLQSHWMQYFPVYVDARWQANVIHNYDLSQYRQLISQGAYTDAAQKLEQAIPLIKLFGREEKILEAESLLSRAEIGIKAGILALESRQAILSLDYSLGYRKAEEALSLYRQLDDSRRIGEVETYINLSTEVLTLREELDLLRGVGSPLDPIRTQRIVAIGRRLNELGDSEGANQVQIALLLLGSGLQVVVQTITVIGLMVCVYLIWRRIVFVRKGLSSKVKLL